MASALGVHDETGRALTERLADYLQAKQLLLILDNCEHLVTACAALVDTFLKSCAQLKILATSRQSLRASGEKVWRVPSLSFPDIKKGISQVTEVSDHEAVRLFVERARQVSSFELDGRNATAVAEICHRLDGIPLALEMAVARLNVMSVHQVAERLRDRFQLLAGNAASALPRQQTLRATIDWSYSLLSHLEQMLFERLAIFAGSFGLDAVEAVCSEPTLPSESILDLLSGLVEKSMVTVDRTSLHARFPFLETLREYGLGKLRQRGDETSTRNKHADFFAVLAERVKSEVHRAGWARSRCSHRVGS